MNQVSNLAVYAVVERMLLEAHTRMSALAACMDVNDFVHVDSVYLPQCSTGAEPSSVVSVPTIVPTHDVSVLPEPTCGEGTMAPPALRPSMAPMNLPPLTPSDFDVGDYLNHPSPVEDLDFGDRFDQYGSQLSRGRDDSAELLITPESSPSLR